MVWCPKCTWACLGYDEELGATAEVPLVFPKCLQTIWASQGPESNAAPWLFGQIQASWWAPMRQVPQVSWREVHLDMVTIATKAVWLSCLLRLIFYPMWDGGKWDQLVQLRTSCWTVPAPPCCRWSLSNGVRNWYSLTNRQKEANACYSWTLFGPSIKINVYSIMLIMLLLFFSPFQLFLTLKRTKLVKAVQLKLKCVDQVYFQGSILLTLQAESLCGTNTITFSLNLSPI